MTPDYAITHIRYKIIGGSKHIHQLWVAPYIKEDTIGTGSIYSKTQVIAKIISGKHINTLWTDEKGILHDGADVHLVSVNRSAYLRTDKNEIDEDSLGELPSF